MIKDSQLAQKWLFRLLSFTLALFLWLYVRLEREEELIVDKIVNVEITYALPENTEILNPVNKISARIRGKEREVKNISVLHSIVSISPNKIGNVEIKINPDNIKLPEGVKIVSLEPDRFTVTIDKVIEKLFPVKVEFVGEPAAGAEVGTPTIVPDKLPVRGPSSVLKEIDSLIATVDLSGHAITFEERVIAKSPHTKAKIIGSPVVQVTIPMYQPEPLEINIDEEKITETEEIIPDVKWRLKENNERR